MFCVKCGNELPDGAAFCASCGKAISAPATNNGDKASISGAASAKATAAVDVGPIVGGFAPAKRKGRKAIAAVAAVLVIVVAGVGAYFAFFAPYELDEKTFPDSSVRSALASQADVDHDGKVSRDEARALSSFDIAGTGAASIEGLERFPNLVSLDLSSTSVASLDTSPFPLLETLKARDCANLSQVKLGGSPALRHVDLQDAPATELDVSKLAALEELDAYGVPLETLDVSGNTGLSRLRAAESVVVEGLDSTLLREQWLMTEYKRNGSDGYGTQQAFDSDTVFDYDADNRLVRVESTSFEHGTGRVVSGPNVETYEYDDAGRFVAMDSDGYLGRVTVSYDHGRISVITDRNGTWECECDEDGRITRMTNGSNIKWYEYDDAGRPTKSELSVSDFRTTANLYTYDDDGQLTSIDFKDATNTFTRAYDFEYDGTGRCAKVLQHKMYGSGEAEFTFSYDEQGRAVCQGGVDLVYDEHGNLVGRAFDGGYSTEIAYRRVFTAKDASDLVQPIEVGNPYTVSRRVYPYSPNLSTVEDSISRSYGPYLGA